MVYSNPSATITPQGPTTFCVGDSVQLKTALNNGWTYQWKRNNQNLNGANSNKYFAKTAGFYKVKVTNGHGCTAISSPVQVSVPCREAKPLTHAPEPEVIIYPNPSSGDFVIEIKDATEESITITVFDLDGREIQAGINQMSLFKFKISGIESGIYMAKIKCGNENIFSKIVKT